MKFSFSFQLILFLCVFLSLSLYMVGSLETEDGRMLLYLVLVGGFVSTIRALYLKNKILKQQAALEEVTKDQL